MRSISKLEESLNRLFGWHKSRMSCFVRLVLAMLTVRTVNLQELAVGFLSKAQIESRYRRIRRFIAELSIDYDVLARWLFYLFFSSAPSVYVIIDRTDWRWGRAAINIFTLSVAYEGLAIPLYWKVLKKKGTSNTSERQALLQRFIDNFGTTCMEALLADREFVGKQWFCWLNRQKIPFYIRIKDKTVLRFKRKKWRTAKQLFKHLALNEQYIFPMPVYVYDQKCYIAGAKSYRGELMVILSNRYHAQPIALYLRRWEIESLFQSLKSRGFRLEDTHVTQADRLERLIAVVAVTFAWAHKIGEWQAIKKPIPMKQFKDSQRPQHSYFRYGLDYVRSALTQTATQFINQCMKLLIIPTLDFYEKTLKNLTLGATP